MIDLNSIKQYFPQYIQSNSVFDKYLIKEYIQLLILDYLSTTSYVSKLTFIGGTHLRLVKGINRFSEDLDFDCKNLSIDDFIQMTDGILLFLERNGYRVEARDHKKENLKAFRRNIHFPEFLFDMGLSGHKEERFLIKIESQDQLFKYNPIITNIKGCGFYFPFPVPPLEVLCSMKISALLSRQKGRDFYDVIFLMGLTKPDYHFLTNKMGIKNLSELKQSINKMLTSVDLTVKMKDFEHLLFNKKHSDQIIHFEQYFTELSS